MDTKRKKKHQPQMNPPSLRNMNYFQSHEGYGETSCRSTQMTQATNGVNGESALLNFLITDY
ncbi:MAG: hypothetical protein JOZ31_22700 [Verrucomicrobia bacterium]|nr:hypothetical protein [Verrucomicrobiota bacterium]MBV8484172.1 hypothetical protein [Verrucomicrobiota bacterium]